MQTKLHFLALLSALCLMANGQTWKHYVMDNTSTQLCNSDVFVIAVDHDSSLWFGTSDGISRFDGKNWTSYAQENGLLINSINAICIVSFPEHRPVKIRV